MSLLTIQIYLWNKLLYEKRKKVDNTLFQYVE